MRPAAWTNHAETSARQFVDLPLRASVGNGHLRRCSGLENEKIVAIGFLTEKNVKALGTSLRKVIPITDDGRFDDLLSALDKAHPKPAD